MVGVVGVIALFTVLALSLFITRLATTALAATGLSWQAARFQARSAFTGTGFTTSEAEKVVDHPVRRRIIMLLMIARSAGLVSIVISLILSFADAGGPQVLWRLGWLAGGVAALYAAAATPWVDRGLSRLINWALRRWTDLDTRDYYGLLQLSGEYAVHEMRVQEGDWVAGRDLDDCQLNQEGVLVLGIRREDGSYVGAPKGTTTIHAGDTLLLYGRGKTLQDLDRRRADPAGDVEHREAVSEQERHEAEQERREAAREARRQGRGPRGGGPKDNS
jgi:hypothetical protein